MTDEAAPAPQTAPASKSQATNSRHKNVARLRPPELDRIRCGRYGQHGEIPADDATGRILAKAMLDSLALRPGCEARMAKFLERYCRWMGAEDRQQAIQLAIRKPKYWSASALGDVLKLTVKEREKWGITTIRPAGFGDAEMAAMRGEKDKVRKQAERDLKRLHPTPKPNKPALRLEAIIQVLNTSPTNQWTRVPALCAELKRKKFIHFAGLDDASLGAAVHVAIQLGVTTMMIEKRSMPGRRPNIVVTEIRKRRAS